MKWRLTFSEAPLNFRLGFEDSGFNVAFNEPEFHVKFGEHFVIGELDPYTGSYHVIPKIRSQVLETSNKSMTDDVTVDGIPSWVVANQTGDTFIIGE